VHETGSGYTAAKNRREHGNTALDSIKCTEVDYPSKNSLTQTGSVMKMCSVCLSYTYQDMHSSSFALKTAPSIYSRAFLSIFFIYWVTFRRIREIANSDC
jgi:hypothetical protein